MTTGAIARDRTSRQTSKRIYEACLHNLALYLEGRVSFEEWRSRQEELESRLSPAPELPFHQEGRGEGSAGKGCSRPRKAA